MRMSISSRGGCAAPRTEARGSGRAHPSTRPRASKRRSSSARASASGRERSLTEAVLMEGAVVEEGAQVVRSIVGPGGIVGKGAVLVDSVLGGGVRVPPGVRLEGSPAELRDASFLRIRGRELNRRGSGTDWVGCPTRPWEPGWFDLFDVSSPRCWLSRHSQVDLSRRRATTSASTAPATVTASGCHSGAHTDLPTRAGRIDRSSRTSTREPRWCGHRHFRGRSEWGSPAAAPTIHLTARNGPVRLWMDGPGATFVAKIPRGKTWTVSAASVENKYAIRDHTGALVAWPPMGRPGPASVRHVRRLGRSCLRARGR